MPIAAPLPGGGCSRSGAVNATREALNKYRGLLAKGSPSLAEVAIRAGYYDQAHLNRDVSALAGCTPAELAGELASDAPPDP